MAKGRYSDVDSEINRSKYYTPGGKPMTGQTLKDTREGDRQNMRDLEDDQRYGEQQMQPAAGKPLGSYKKGGTVPKTGTYKLHKGEKVVPTKKVAAKPAARTAARKR